MVQSVSWNHLHQVDSWLTFEIRKRDKTQMSTSGRRRRGRGRGRCKKLSGGLRRWFRAAKVPIDESWVVHNFFGNFCIRIISCCGCGKNVTEFLPCVPVRVDKYMLEIYPLPVQGPTHPTLMDIPPLSGSILKRSCLDGLCPTS